MLDAKTFVFNFSQKNKNYIIRNLYYVKSMDAYIAYTEKKTWDGTMRNVAFGSSPSLYHPNGEWFYDEKLDPLDVIHDEEKCIEVDFLPYISDEDREKVEKFNKELNERGGSWIDIWPKELDD